MLLSLKNKESLYIGLSHQSNIFRWIIKIQEMFDKSERVLKKMYFLTYWGIKVFFNFLHVVVASFTSVIYFGKGKVVPAIKNPLLLKSATKLAKEIREGKVKCEDVILAYIERIQEVNPYLNALAEERFEDAINDAKEVDAFLAEGNFSVKQLEDEKPLLGVPMTVKVLLSVKGLPWTAAISLFKDNIADEDAPSVVLLRKAGAIVLTTTNAATFGIGFDTVNPLYGLTRNPYDTNRTPGGSSGGEAALLASAASVIGLGNDLAGSIRLPSHFCGIYSHKASLGLVPSLGSFPKMNEVTEKYMFTGPMCRYSEDLITMMKILTSENKEKINIDRPVNFRKLKVFYQCNISDPKIRDVDREISQTIRKAARHFKENYGVIIQEVDIKELKLATLIVIHILMKDIPNPIAMVTNGKLTHIDYFQEIFKMFLGKSDHALWTVLILGLRKLFYKEKLVPYLNTALRRMYEKFDAMLDENSVFFLPGAPFSAPRPYEMLALIGGSCYSGIFNYLGLPTTQCPLGLDRNGMPYGMQIVGRMNNDPLTLACAVELGKVFGGWIPPS